MIGLDLEDLSSAAHVRTFFSFFSCLVVAMVYVRESSCIARKDCRAMSPVGLLAHQKHSRSLALKVNTLRRGRRRGYVDKVSAGT